MPTPKPSSKAKRPKKLNPLAEYILLESEREGAGPDKQTREQLDLLTSGKPTKASAAKSAAKSTNGPTKPQNKRKR
jgi:hypothetical protein